MKAKNPLLGCLAAAAALAVPSFASAQEAQGAPAALSEIIRGFEQNGYTVEEAEREGQYYEIESVKADGQKIHFRVEAASGRVLREWNEN